MSVRLWDVEMKKELWQNKESTGDVMVVVPINSETYLSAGIDQKIHLLDSRQKDTNLKIFSGHESDINSLYLSVDQTIFATVSDDGTCRIWDIRNGKQRKTYQVSNDSLACVALSGSTQTLYCGGGNCNLHVRDVTNDVSKQNIKDHENRISCLHISNDGRVLVSGSWDSTINIWSNLDI